MKKSPWTKPTLAELGTIEELTRQGKFSGSSDGATQNGVPIGELPS